MIKALVLCLLLAFGGARKTDRVTVPPSGALKTHFGDMGVPPTFDRETGLSAQLGGRKMPAHVVRRRVGEAVDGYEHHLRQGLSRSAAEDEVRKLRELEGYIVDVCTGNCDHEYRKFHP